MTAQAVQRLQRGCDEAKSTMADVGLVARCRPHTSLSDGLMAAVDPCRTSMAMTNFAPVRREHFGSHYHLLCRGRHVCRVFAEFAAQRDLLRYKTTPHADEKPLSPWPLGDAIHRSAGVGHQPCKLLYIRHGPSSRLNVRYRPRG